MGEITQAPPTTVEVLSEFGRLVGGLQYKGPRLHYHLLPAQRAGEVLLYGWLDERESRQGQTDRPNFSAMGTVRSTFEAFKQWLTREGWI